MSKAIKSTSFYCRFELDIVSALKHQLIEAFDKLKPGDLTEKNIAAVPEEPGVYQLYYSEALVYVGKTDNLRKRLQEHHQKISGRRNIQPSEVGLTCLSVHSGIHAVSEVSLINHYKSAPGGCTWNGNGFGPHDPGRTRETTGKPPDGFDAQFPIRDDWPCTWITEGEWNCNKLLQEIKSRLPFLLRYQVAHTNKWKAGHPDYNNVSINVPRSGMPARELLRLIAGQLPGWQATRFPSHFILYKEDQRYKHGSVI